MESLKKRSNLLILSILFFSGLGIILNFDNLREIGFFVILFFSFHLIFKDEDKILNNFIFNLVIFSILFFCRDLEIQSAKRVLVGGGFGFLFILISFGATKKRKGGAKKIQKKPTD